MSITENNSWTPIKWLLDNGISIIPVRDKPQGKYVAKTPYQDWKQYQSEIISMPILWEQMDKHNTTAVAMIGGKISGNLEIIDIDVKYKPGIDASIFMSLKDLYPVLFSILRIHKTPSGGYHMLYRVSSNIVPGSKKLAGRLKTDAELKYDTENSGGKKVGKTVNFIETRGEGGFALAPPSLNYTVFQDVPIPIISWEDRCSIINILCGFSEIIEVEKVYKPTKNDNSYYDENPFEHFNKGNEADCVLELAGWSRIKKENSIFIWFTRPGKDSGISASFNKKKNMYYIFTASTELEESKGYHPSVLLSILLHNDDRKATYQYLVQKGYGKIKQSVEQRLTKNKAVSGKPLPSNASPEAKLEYANKVIELSSTYPYGVFWEFNRENNMSISREKFYKVADGLGFKLHQSEPVCIEGYIIKKQTERDFFDAIKAYIKEDDADTYIDIANAFESFIQKNGTFTISRLQILNTDSIVKDTNNTAYKFYNNGFLFITASEFSFKTYDTLSGFIWYENILQRTYIACASGGKYVEFLKLCTKYDSNESHIKKVIGYLAHQFKDETTAYIVVLTEECADPKNGGGSGKNIFSSLFGKTTTYTSIPGDVISYDSKFLQSWNGQRIFGISDVPKKFNFSFLKEPSSGGGLLEKKFKDQKTIDVQDMPKFLIQTNFGYETSDGGLKRRIIPIEFTDFFTKAGGVDVHFGCHFPNGWVLADWNGYDNFIAECIVEWISGGLKLQAPDLSVGGWHKQFNQNHGVICTTIIDENIEKWLELEWVSNSVFKAHIEDYYKENNTPILYRPSINKINDALKDYCNHYEYDFLTNQSHRTNTLLQEKHRYFGKKGSTPF